MLAIVTKYRFFFNCVKCSSVLPATLSDDTQIYVSETEDFHISYHHTDTAANAVGSHLSADKPPESVTHFLRLIPKVTTRAAASFISLRSKSRRVSIHVNLLLLQKMNEGLANFF